MSRAMSLMAVVALLAGCSLIGSSYLDDLDPNGTNATNGTGAAAGGGSTAGGQTGAAGTTDIGGGGNTGGSTSAGGSECGEAPPPPGGSCPAVCTGGCGDGLCVINNLGSYMPEDIVSCPDGFHCEFDCSGQQTCDQLVLQCASTYRCEINCICGGSNSQCCNETVVECGSGPCNLQCAGNQACKNAALTCGANQCTADCGQNGNGVSITCSSSCATSLTNCPAPEDSPCLP